jgi:hypothetical protein
MRLTRSSVSLAFLVLVVVLGAPQIAGARGLRRADRPLLAPTHRVDGLDAGEAMGLTWGLVYTLPEDENSAPCLRLGRHHEILLPNGSEEVPCTVDSHSTILVWGISNTCDTLDPLSPFYAVDERAQRACAAATIEPYVQEIRLTIDGGTPVDMHQERYAIFSPQQAVRLGADNPFGVPPGPATLTAYGWMAWLRKLSPGRHTLVTETVFNDGSEHVILSNLDVIRHGDADNDG